MSRSHSWLEKAAACCSTARSASPARPVGCASSRGFRLGARLYTRPEVSFRCSLMAVLSDFAGKPQHQQPERQQRELTKSESKQHHESRQAHLDAPRCCHCVTANGKKCPV